MSCILLLVVLLGGLAAPAAHARPAPADTARAETCLEEAACAFHPKRFWYGVGGFLAADAVAMYGLSRLWYGEQGQTSFGFYSDRVETLYPGFEGDGWLDDWHTYAQQDKLGHLFTAWHLTRLAGAYGRWAGLSRGEAALFGGAASTLFQLQVEVLDGFSKAYGFSRTDFLANVAGSLIGGFKAAYPDELGWFTAKYSYHRSPYYGADAAGAGLTGYLGNAIKDYDGISYWLVLRPEELLSESAAARWPDWLALSVGYSADGLAHEISGYSAGGGRGEGPVHRRELYLSPDLDVLHDLDVPEPFRTIARVLSFIRLPAPALQLTPEVRWHWVFY